MGVGRKGTDAWLPIAAPVEGQKGIIVVLGRVTNHFGLPETVLVLILKVPYPDHTRTRVPLLIRPTGSPCRKGRRETPWPNAKESVN